jgi:predicted CopG family antitoxin
MITINITKKTWEKLNKLKEAGETFEEVINKILLNQNKTNKNGK